MSELAAWPPSAWLALLGLAGTALWRPARLLWQRFVSREQHDLDLVEVLRIALDKEGMRRNSAETVCHILLLALEVAAGELQNPPAAIASALEQAKEIIRVAVERAAQINRGGR